MLDSQCDLIRELHLKRCSAHTRELQRVSDLQLERLSAQQRDEARSDGGGGSIGIVYGEAEDGVEDLDDEDDAISFTPTVGSFSPSGGTASWSVDAAVESAVMAMRRLGPVRGAAVVSALASHVAVRGASSSQRSGESGIAKEEARFASIRAGPGPEQEQEADIDDASNASMILTCGGPAQNLTSLSLAMVGSRSHFLLNVSCDGLSAELSPVLGNRGYGKGGTLPEAVDGGTSCGGMVGHTSLFPALDDGIHTAITAMQASPPAIWHRTSSLCLRGQPPSPREGMLAVHLRWPHVAVFFGGQIELGGPVEDTMLVSGLPRLRRSVSNDTYFLGGMSLDAARSAGHGPYACDPAQSVGMQRVRLLPDGT